MELLLREEPLNHLLSSLQEIAQTPSIDSELYGCAIAAKAFSETAKTCNADQKFNLYKVVGGIFDGTFNQIVNRFSLRRDYLAKVFVSKLIEFHRKRDVNLPHLDIYFTLLLTETFDSLAKKHAKAIPDGIYMGKKLSSLICLSERDGLEKSLDDLQEKYPMSDEILSNLKRVINKHRNERIEDHFNRMQNEFEMYNFDEQALRALTRTLLGKEIGTIRVVKKVSYLLSRSWEKRKEVSYIMASTRSDPRETTIFCNFWPLFLGSVWKIVLIHELIHAVFPFRCSSESFSKKKDFAENVKNVSFQELCHGLINFFTIQEARKDSLLKPYSNITLGLIPFGRLISMAWYRSMEKKWRGITLKIPVTLNELKTPSNSKEVLVSALNKSLEKLGKEAKLTEKDLPNLQIFCSQDMLTEGIIKNPNDAHLREAGVVRCIFKILLYSVKPLPAEKICELVRSKDLQKALKLVLYMPRRGFSEDEIYQALEMLSRMSIVERKNESYRLVV